MISFSRFRDLKKNADIFQVILNISFSSFLLIAFSHTNANAESEYPLFDQYAYDLENPAVKEEIRTASHSVASIGYASGNFTVEVSPEFLNISVQLPSGEAVPMRQVILEQIGGLMKDKSGGTFISINKVHEDAFFSLLKKYHLALSNLQWNGGKLISQIKSASELTEEINAGQRIPGNGHCTGWLVSENIAITNNHCIPTQDKCSILSFRFNEELDADLKKVKNLDSYKCQKLLLTDKELDFSLVLLEGAPGKIHGKLELSETMPSLKRFQNSGLSIWPFQSFEEIPAEKLIVIGHPRIDKNGFFKEDPTSTVKKVTVPCEATDVEERWVGAPESKEIGATDIDFDVLFGQHKLVNKINIVWGMTLNCPVLGGNSGSPVLNSRLKAVGLLNSGDENWAKTPNVKPYSRMVPLSKIFQKYRHDLARWGIFSIESKISKDFIIPQNR